MIQCTRCGGGVPLADLMILELEKENARLRDLLKWALTYVETEHERGSNHTNEVEMLKLAHAELGKL